MSASDLWNSRPGCVGAGGNLKLLYNDWAEKFKNNATPGFKKIQNEGNYKHTTNWGKDGWAYSSYAGIGPNKGKNITAYSKRIKIDGKEFSLEVKHGDHYSVNLYSANGRLLASTKPANCSGYLLGRYEDRASLKILQSAISMVEGKATNVFVEIPNSGIIFNDLVDVAEIK